MLIVTSLILLIGWNQLAQLKKEKKIEFTYSVYKDLCNFLNDARNEKINDWFYDLLPRDSKIEVNSKDWIKIGKLLEKFESIAAFKDRKVIDEKIYEGIISTYIWEMFTYTKNPTVVQYIEAERNEAREKYKDNDAAELYSGTLFLKSEIDKS